MRHRSGANGASGNTATATTAIAERTGEINGESGRRSGYVGRFAPSPTGRLHLGSLATALASRLEALRHYGRWLLRIEDLDAGRVRTEFLTHQLGTLEALGFEWQEAPMRQSAGQVRYAQALEQLAPHLYRCWCTRRDLSALSGDQPTGYPGTCRTVAPRAGPAALRLRLDASATECFDDLLQGRQCFELGQLGDPVLCTRDGVASYQLAVVVDDAAQGVTQVVRGADLLPSTAWQRVLQRLLGLPEPTYLHLPLVTDPDGSKLAKTAHSLPLDPAEPALWLYRALQCLRQQPPDALATADPASIWSWAQANWNINRLRGLPRLAAYP